MLQSTTKPQRSPVDLAADVLDFMQHIQPKVSEQNHNPKFIINMDQTPIFFTCHQRKCWNGKNKISKYSFFNERQKTTLAVCMCTDGTHLPPMLTFKGTQDGWMAKKSSKNFHPAVSITARKVHG